MRTRHDFSDEVQPHASRSVRRLLVAAGILLTGLGIAGVVLPGVPTTFPLIVAVWCFSRSFPSLEQRLVRIPLFRPYLRYIEGAEPMPLRARLVTLAIMWTFVSLSVVWITAAGAPLIASAVTVALALVGTWFIWSRGKVRQTEAPAGAEAPLVETNPQVLLERSKQAPEVPTHASRSDAHVDRVGA